MHKIWFCIIALVCQGCAQTQLPAGTAKWTSQSIAGYGNPPALSADGSSVYVTGTNLVALDAVTGAKKWTYNATRGWLEGPPVLSSDGLKLYVSAGFYSAGQFGDLFALHTRDGSVMWSYLNFPGYGDPPALRADGNVVYVTGTNLAALDAATGAEQWTYQVAKGWLEGPPALSPDGLTLYVSTGFYSDAQLGGLYALRTNATSTTSTTWTATTTTTTAGRTIETSVMATTSGATIAKTTLSTVAATGVSATTAGSIGQSASTKLETSVTVIVPDCGTARNMMQDSKTQEAFRKALKLKDVTSVTVVLTATGCGSRRLQNEIRILSNPAVKADYMIVVPSGVMISLIMLPTQAQYQAALETELKNTEFKNTTVTASAPTKLSVASSGTSGKSEDSRIVSATVGAQVALPMLTTLSAGLSW